MKLLSINRKKRKLLLEMRKEKIRTRKKNSFKTGKIKEEEGMAVSAAVWSRGG